MSIEAAAYALASNLLEQEYGEPPTGVGLDEDLNIDWLDQGQTNMGQAARAALQHQAVYRSDFYDPRARGVHR